MPALIVSARYTSDAATLRQTAQRIGWNTLRLDGQQIPEWFECEDGNVALYYTPPRAFDVAQQLSLTLLGCDSRWLLDLPCEFLQREIRQMTLREALQLPERRFIKPALSKSFPGKVYDADSLAKATAEFLPTCLVHVAEQVDWSVEYRCFVLDKRVVTISPYKRHGEIIRDHFDRLSAPNHEVETAKQFCDSVLECPSVASPAAFVVDVGVITGRGWAVIEPNECWAAGIYGCDPESVLQTLLRACVSSDQMTESDRRWNFKRHYFTAYP